MRINNNLMAMNTHRQLGINSASGAKSIEKLSSGLRINRAGDDAAGLSISEKMRGQIRGLNQASRNAQDGISLIQTAEGALSETHAILQRMKELATQAASDTNTTADRKEIQKEMNQLTSEINRIGNNTEFNTQKLLNGNKTGAASDGTAVPAVPEKLGEMTTTVDGTVNVKIDGVDFTYAASPSTATEFDDLDALVSAITSHATLGAKYTASNESGNLKLVQKVGHGSSTAANIDGSVVSFDTGKEGAAEIPAIPAGDKKDGEATLQIGANQSQSFTISINDMRSSVLGISGAAGGAAAGVDATDAVTGASFAATTDTDKLADKSVATGDEYALDVTSNTKASAAIKVIDQAIANVSSERSKLGAYQNRLEHTIKNLDTSSENLQAAESRIRDVDMAKEMMEFTKNNILQQAAQAMLAQANQAPQGVLQLLR